ncbi:uncharacterized protein LOC143834116 [Paroedura picta]|uniref:uncharacterized protein LOC143834116 n=1 Tax=Paroedura picta TaxID=143630 RepID=UPI004056E859
MFVNRLKRREELPGGAKKPRLMEAKQGVDGSANVSGDEQLGEIEEEPKPFLESPEEEESQEKTSEAVQENDSPQAGHGRLSKTEEEEGKASLESPEEEGQQETTTETAKENASPCVWKGEETPTCSKCGRTFWQRSDQTDCAGEKCSECWRCQDLSSDLAVQARKCMEEKPFSCSVCEKSFHYVWDFLKHQSIHKSVQPLLCGVCGRNIGRTPTGHRPYKCVDCEKR